MSVCRTQLLGLILTDIKWMIPASFRACSIANSNRLSDIPASFRDSIISDSAAKLRGRPLNPLSSPIIADDSDQDASDEVQDISRIKVGIVILQYRLMPLWKRSQEDRPRA